MTALVDTLVSALEVAAAKGRTDRGFHFLQDDQAGSFYSFAAIERASSRIAGALQQRGLRPSDRVALLLPDGDDFIIALLGVMRAGLIPVPIFPPLGPGQLGTYLDNTRHIVAASRSRALVTIPRLGLLLGRVQTGCPALRHVLSIDELRRERLEHRPVTLRPDDVALLQFTSGSTSAPKGVVLTHAAITANVKGINHVLSVGENDVAVSWLPLFHDMGLVGFVFAPIFAAATSALLSPLSFLRRPVLWLQTLSRLGGTISYAPGFAYGLTVKRFRERDMHGIDLSSWRVAGSGAEPIRAENLQLFARTFSPWGFKSSAFTPSYGLAEATLAVTMARPGDGLVTDAVHGPTLWQDGVARPISDDHDEAVHLVRCGRSLPEHKVAVFSPEDGWSHHPLPDRTVGEIRVRGLSVMRGYISEHDLNREAFAGGWLRTGDLGYLSDGELVPCGRLKEVILLNGRNFYPQDMEWEAARVDGVRKGGVIAFGRWDTNLGRERVVVLFETDAASYDERLRLVGAVRRAIQDGLGITVDDVIPLREGVLPKTSSGKPRRLTARLLFERNELDDPRRTRTSNRIDEARELLRSQLAFAVGRLTRPSTKT